MRDWGWERREGEWEWKESLLSSEAWPHPPHSPGCGKTEIRLWTDQIVPYKNASLSRKRRGVGAVVLSPPTPHKKYISWSDWTEKTFFFQRYQWWWCLCAWWGVQGRQGDERRVGRQDFRGKDEVIDLWGVGWWEREYSTLQRATAVGNGVELANKFVSKLNKEYISVKIIDKVWTCELNLAIYKWRQHSAIQPFSFSSSTFHTEHPA